MRGSPYHSHPICNPCFIIWYDCVVDQTSPEAVGRESLRRKAAGKWPWDEKSLSRFRRDVPFI